MGYNLFSDTKLLSLLKADDESAFEEIYRRYWHTLYQSAWKRLKDQELSKDIVQDVFIYFWNRRTALTIENIEAWLKTAVKYQVYKSISRNRAGESIYTIWNMPEVSYEQADNLIRTKELNSALQDFIGTLPVKRREIFRLRYDENLSTADIAHKLDISRKTVQNQLTKAMQKIHESLVHLLALLFFLLKG